MVSSGPGLLDLVLQNLGVAIVPVGVPLKPSPGARSLLAQLEAPAAR